MRRKIVATALCLSIPLSAGADRPVEGVRGADVLHSLHIELERSIPAEDSVIRSALDRVVLEYSGPVEARLSRLVWIGPAGDSLTLRVSAAPDQPHVLIGEAPPAANGRQTLVWRTVSADGHQVDGEITFVGDIPGLAEPDTSVAAADSAPTAPASEAVESAPSTTVDAEASGLPPLRLAIRGAGMFCLLAFAGLLWFGAGTTLLDEPRTHHAASLLGLGATILLTADALLWLLDLRPPDASLTEVLGIVGGSRTGVAELGRPILAALAFLLFTGTRAVRIGALVSMLAVLVGALGGHQATISPLVSLPANALHLGAAAVWTGGLLLLGWWPSRPDEKVDVGWTFPRVALRVSSAALIASGVILVSGIVQDLLYLPSLGSLWSTTYGNLLLAKGGGFLALVGFGAYHRFRLMPALLDADSSHRPLRRGVRFELIVMIVVVFVAVALAQVPPPVE